VLSCNVLRVWVSLAPGGHLAGSASARWMALTRVPYQFHQVMTQSQVCNLNLSLQHQTKPASCIQFCSMNASMQQNDQFGLALRHQAELQLAPGQPVGSGSLYQMRKYTHTRRMQCVGRWASAQDIQVIL